MGNTSSKLIFKISGMDCVEEVSILKRELASLVGGEGNLSFDVLNARMTVEVNSSGLSAQAIIDVVKKTGMRAEPWSPDDESQKPITFWQQYGQIITTSASGICMLIAFLLHIKMAGGIGNVLRSETPENPKPSPDMIVMFFYLAGIVSGAWFVFPKALYAVRRMRPDMNLIMMIAVVGAVAIGEWFEGAAVAFLFAFSHLLESWSVGRARRAIAALMNLAPPVARIRQDNGEVQEVSPNDVPVGGIVVVRPGEKIPLDGVVVKGASGVNQAPITGESVPVEKELGDEVFAGTINGDGSLEIESTKPASDTTLARIIKMVGDAQSRRAPSEKWVEKFAVIYTPIVLVVALLVLFVPPLFFAGAWSVWIYKSLVLLVIACPCALVISTPVSVVASLASSARNGVLIKGGIFVELPAKLKAIAMDKTGTLTMGEPSVIDVVPLNGHTEEELLARAGALEVHSNHPLARAIVKETEERKISLPPADQFEIMQGKGATGKIDGKTFWIGSHRYLEERKQETPEVHDQLEEMQKAGRTVVVVGNEEHVCGFITLADAIRSESKQSLIELRELGIEHLVMLTGDNAGTAQAIASQSGIDEVHSELLPEDKVSAVESLVAKYEFVAMIGDGVNDAPALGRASLGIAMGAAGSDAAIET
ncbi:Lead, cadmium, zinc and mercury transporting ATPase; Copper-translocating P-type ATPase, partial [hydrothermal vent metagenome]